MFRFEMLNERTPFYARRIAQPKRRCESAINHDDAFESTNDRRKMLGAQYLLGNEFPAAGNLNLTTTDRSSQSLTGRLTHTRGLLEKKPFRFGRGEDGSRERML